MVSDIIIALWLFESLWTWEAKARTCWYIFTFPNLPQVLCFDDFFCNNLCPGFFFFLKLMLTCYFNKKDLKDTPKSKSSYIYLQRLLPLLLHTLILSGSVNLLKYRMNDQVMINSYVGQPPLKPHPEPTTPPLLCSWTTNHIPWECILCLICFLHFEKYFIYVFMFIMHLCDFQNLGVWGGQHYKGRIGS